MLSVLGRCIVAYYRWSCFDYSCLILPTVKTCFQLFATRIYFSHVGKICLLSIHSFSGVEISWQPNLNLLTLCFGKVLMDVKK